MEKIGGVDCYVGTPEGDYAKDKVFLYLFDAFGLPLVNNKLLVDDFANNGYKTIAPDFFNGDPVPLDGFEPGSTFDVQEWVARNTAAATRVPVDKVIKALKEQGVTKFAAVGYCFGARHVFDLAIENETQASIVAHPSLLKCPEDLEKYRSTAKAPLLINSCSNDSQFPLEKQAQADEILGGGKFAPGYKREFFDGCSHGFACRGDISDPKVKAGKEGAFVATVKWLQEYF